MNIFKHSVIWFNLLINYTTTTLSFDFQLAPYVLHLAMVVSVAAYVMVGALTIRRIEAVPKNRALKVGTICLSAFSYF